jgi:hypothetical protein
MYEVSKETAAAGEEHTEGERKRTSKVMGPGL